MLLISDFFDSNGDLAAKVSSIEYFHSDVIFCQRRLEGYIRAAFISDVKYSKKYYQMQKSGEKKL